MNWKIPNETPIFGHNLKTEWDADLVNDQGAFGMIRYAQNTMVLQEPCKEASESLVRQTYFHEYWHCALRHMGYDELADDETFVDRLAQLDLQKTDHLFKVNSCE